MIRIGPWTLFFPTYIMLNLFELNWAYYDWIKLTFIKMNLYFVELNSPGRIFVEF